MARDDLTWWWRADGRIDVLIARLGVDLGTLTLSVDLLSAARQTDLIVLLTQLGADIEDFKAAAAASAQRREREAAKRRRLLHLVGYERGAESGQTE